MNPKFSLSLLGLMIGIAGLAIAQTSSNSSSSSSNQTSTSHSSGTASAQATSSAASGGSASTGMTSTSGMVNGQKVFVIDYSTRSTSSSDTDQMQQTVKDQANYTQQVAKRGSLVIAGQFMDNGNRMMIVLAPNIAAANQMSADSPFVKSGFFTAKVREYYVTQVRQGGETPARNQITATQDSLEDEPKP